MKNRRLTFFILIFSSFAIFGGFAASAFAQDAIQCTPGDVNLNRNLRFIDNDNIYLGTGYLNFSSGNNGLYATNDSANGLLLKSPAAISLQATTDFNIQSGGNVLFKDVSGNTFAQFYPGATPTLAGTGNLLVNGNIEGLENVQGKQVCVTGSNPQCISDWSDVNIAGYGESRCDGANNGALGPCANVVATNNVTATGGDVIAGSDVTAGGNVTSGATISGITLSVSGGATAIGDVTGGRLCIAGDACYDTWTNMIKGVTGGTGKGVSKIIDGDGVGGITLNSPAVAEADGDVTIGLNIASAQLVCVMVPFTASIEYWFDNATALGNHSAPASQKFLDAAKFANPETSPNNSKETKCPVGYKITGLSATPAIVPDSNLGIDMEYYLDGEIFCCDVQY